MSSQSTYRRWRSRTFGELVGQEHVTRTLLNAIKTDRVHHAYLLCGPRGTGKTSTARILAKALNCLDNEGRDEPCNECRMCRAITEGRALDVIEVDAASNRGIDEIRDLRERAGYAPSEARRKVYIIDEAHMLTTAAANAFLKTLEEPPPQTIFILATTEPQLLPATITSRCQRFDFHRIPADAAVGRLAFICGEDGIEASKDVLELIVKSAGGSLRDAQNLLDQLVSFHGPHLSAEVVRERLGLIADERIPALADRILARDVPAALRTVHAALDDGLDLRQLKKELIDFLRMQLLVHFGVETPPGDAPAVSAPPDELIRVLKRLNQADLRGEQLTALPLEIAIVEVGLGLSDAALPSETPPIETGDERALGINTALPIADAAKRSRTSARATRQSSEATAQRTGAGKSHVPEGQRDGGEWEVRAARLMEEAGRALDPTSSMDQPDEAVSSAEHGTGALISAPESEQRPESSLSSPVPLQAMADGRPPDPGEGIAEQVPQLDSSTPLTIDSVRSEWPRVLRALHQTDRRLEGLLRDCEPLALDGEVLHLGFYYDYHKGKVSEPRYRKSVEDAIAQVLGKRFRVSSMLTRRDRQGKLNRVMQDKVLRAALDELGAKLVDVE